jgi:hypothetical protein
MGIIDWIKRKTRRKVREVPGPAPDPLASGPLEKATLRVARASVGGLPGYDSKHGKARGLRYWHKHLSVAARGRKRTLRRIRRESQRYNR